MRRSDLEFVYPKAPVKPGNYVIGLSALCSWYNGLTRTKGKFPHENNLDLILPIIVDRALGNTHDDDDKIDLFLNLDCIIKGEAEFAKRKMEEMVTDQVTAIFPKIGAHLSSDRYTLFNKDLIIDVPPTYEDQRGYFF